MKNCRYKSTNLNIKINLIKFRISFFSKYKKFFRITFEGIDIEIPKILDDGKLNKKSDVPNDDNGDDNCGNIDKCTQDMNLLIENLSKDLSKPLTIFPYYMKPCTKRLIQFFFRYFPSTSVLFQDIKFHSKCSIPNADLLIESIQLNAKTKTIRTSFNEQTNKYSDSNPPPEIQTKKDTSNDIRWDSDLKIKNISIRNKYIDIHNHHNDLNKNTQNSTFDCGNFNDVEKEGICEESTSITISDFVEMNLEFKFDSVKGDISQLSPNIKVKQFTLPVLSIIAITNEIRDLKAISSITENIPTENYFSSSSPSTAKSSQNEGKNKNNIDGKTLSELYLKKLQGGLLLLNKLLESFEKSSISFDNLYIARIPLLSNRDMENVKFTRKKNENDTKFTGGYKIPNKTILFDILVSDLNLNISKIKKNQAGFDLIFQRADKPLQFVLSSLSIKLMVDLEYFNQQPKPDDHSSFSSTERPFFIDFNLFTDRPSTFEFIHAQSFNFTLYTNLSFQLLKFVMFDNQLAVKNSLIISHVNLSGLIVDSYVDNLALIVTKLIDISNDNKIVSLHKKVQANSLNQQDDVSDKEIRENTSETIMFHFKTYVAQLSPYVSLKFLIEKPIFLIKHRETDTNLIQILSLAPSLLNFDLKSSRKIIKDETEYKMELRADVAGSTIDYFQKISDEEEYLKGSTEAGSTTHSNFKKPAFIHETVCELGDTQLKVFFDIFPKLNLLTDLSINYFNLKLVDLAILKGIENIMENLIFNLSIDKDLELSKNAQLLKVKKCSQYRKEEKLDYNDIEILNTLEGYRESEKNKRKNKNIIDEEQLLKNEKYLKFQRSIFQKLPYWIEKFRVSSKYISVKLGARSIYMPVDILKELNVDVTSNDCQFDTVDDKIRYVSLTIDELNFDIINKRTVAESDETSVKTNKNKTTAESANNDNESIITESVATEDISNESTFQFETSSSSHSSSDQFSRYQIWKVKLQVIRTKAFVTSDNYAKSDKSYHMKLINFLNVPNFDISIASVIHEIPKSIYLITRNLKDDNDESKRNNEKNSSGIDRVIVDRKLIAKVNMHKFNVYNSTTVSFILLSSVYLLKNTILAPFLKFKVEKASLIEEKGKIGASLSTLDCLLPVLHASVKMDESVLTFRLHNDLNSRIDLMDISLLMTRFSPLQISTKLARLNVESPSLKDYWSGILSLQAVTCNIGIPKLCKCEELYVDIEDEDLNITIPHDFIVYELFDNIATTVKTLKQMFYILKTNKHDLSIYPCPKKPDLLPKMKLRSRRAAMKLLDDPFEIELGIICQLGLVEQRNRMAKEQRFREYTQNFAAANEDRSSYVEMLSVPDRPLPTNYAKNIQLKNHRPVSRSSIESSLSSSYKSRRTLSSKSSSKSKASSKSVFSSKNKEKLLTPSSSNSSKGSSVKSVADKLSMRRHIAICQEKNNKLKESKNSIDRDADSKASSNTDTGKKNCALASKFQKKPEAPIMSPLPSYNSEISNGENRSSRKMRKSRSSLRKTSSEQLRSKMSSESNTADSSDPLTPLMELEKKYYILKVQHQRSWINLVRGFKDRKNELAAKNDKFLRGVFAGLVESKLFNYKVLDTNNDAPLMGIIFNHLVMGVERSRFPLTELPNYIHRVAEGVPKDTDYTLMVPLYMELKFREARVHLRDYPLPFVHIPKPSSDLPLSTPAMKISGNFVIYEQFEGTEDQIRWIYVPFVASARNKNYKHNANLSACESRKTKYYSLEVPRTITPVKVVTEIQAEVLTDNATKATWGTSYGAILRQLSINFDTFSKPELDPSEKLGTWDKICNNLHGKLCLKWINDGELRINFKASNDPYQVLGHAGGYSLIFNKDISFHVHDPDYPKDFIVANSKKVSWCVPNHLAEPLPVWISDKPIFLPKKLLHDGRGVDPEYGHERYPMLSSSMYGYYLEDGLYLKSHTEIESPIVKRSSKDYCTKVNVKLKGNIQLKVFFEFERKLPNGTRSNEFIPHYKVKLKVPDFIDDIKKYDAYEGFRSHYIHMGFAFNSFPTDSDNEKEFMNSLHTTYQSWSHFFSWWKMFGNGLSLPIRNGKLFDRNLESVSFGAHLFTIKFNFNIQPLWLFHGYRLDISDDEESDARGIGLKAKVEKLDMRLYMRKELKLKQNITLGETSSIQKMVMYLGSIDFNNIDIRAIEALFSFKHDNVKGRIYSVFDDDKRWFDNDDYEEISFASVKDLPGTAKALPLLFAPNLTYSRCTDHQFSKGYTDIKTGKKFKLFDEVKAHQSILGYIYEHVDSKHKDKEFEFHNLFVVHKMLLKWNCEVRDILFKFFFEFQLRKSISGVCRLGMMNFLNDPVTKVQNSRDTGLDNIIEEEGGNEGGDNFGECAGSQKCKSGEARLRDFQSDLRRISSYVAEQASSLFVSNDFLIKLIFPQIQLSLDNTTSYCVLLKTPLIDMSIVSIKERSRFDLQNKQKMKNKNRIEADHGEKYNDPKVISSVKSDDESIKSNTTVSSELTSGKSQLDSKGSDINSLESDDKEGTNDSMDSLEAQTFETRFGALFKEADMFVLYKDDISASMKENDIIKYGTLDVWPPFFKSETFDEQLQKLRVLSKTSISLEFDTVANMGSLNPEEGDSKSRNKIIFEVPKVEVFMDSQQYYAFYSLAVNLLLYVEPSSKKLEEVLEKMKVVTDVSDLNELLKRAFELGQLAPVLATMQENLLFKRSLWDDLDMATFSDITDLKISTFRELFMVMSMIALGGHSSSNETTDVEWVMKSDEILLHMLEEDRQELVQLRIKDGFFRRLQTTDQSDKNYLEIGKIEAVNLDDDVLYPELLKNFDDKSCTIRSCGSKRNRKLRSLTDSSVAVFWSMKKPVGGIRVIKSLDIKCLPLSLALEETTGRKIISYVFPDGETLNSNTERLRSDNQQINLQKNLRKIVYASNRKDTDITSNYSTNNSSSDEDSDSDSDDIREGKKDDDFSDSDTSSQSSEFYDPRLDEDDLGLNLPKEEATEMLERASNYFSIGKVKVHPVVLCVSFSGDGVVSLVNVSNFILRLPPLVIENKLWKMYDLFECLKKYIIKSLLKHTGSLLANKLKVRKRMKRVSLRKIRDKIV
ncbi:hypothetical protein BVG19_g3 [[Candida] boidinii]|nr:hypothetical protein BVG19_g3 [[Candida] boidinii]OWB52297.1 hypothetical protein B5S27_g3870 [[Candida] boidinii]